MKYDIAKHASEGGKACFNKVGKKGMKELGKKGALKRWKLKRKKK